jgi:protein TonB
MIKHLTVLLFATTAICTNLHAQDSLKAAPPQQKIYQHVAYPAHFPGGEKAMCTFISKKLRYPEAAVKANKEGLVKVRFTVRENGLIDSVAIEKSAGFGMDEEAVRVIKAMPRWKPCRVDGVRVNSHYYVPMSFKLAN